MKKESWAEKIMDWVVWGDKDNDNIYDRMKEKPHCPKCGESVLGDEDGLCSRCV